MTDSIQATPRGVFSGMLADALRAGKDGLNYPGKLWGIGAGDLLLGDADRTMNNLSYGQSPFSHGAGMTTRMDSGLADMAMLPGVASLAGLLRKGGSAVASKLLPEAVDMSRRAALGKIGTGATAAAIAPSIVSDALRGISKSAQGVAESEAAGALRAAAPRVVSAVGASRGAAISALNRMRAFWGTHGELGNDLAHFKGGDFDAESALENLQKVAGSDEGMERISKLFERGSPADDLRDLEFDEDAFKSFIESHPNYEQTHMTYGLTPKEYNDAQEMFTTRGPWSTSEKWLDDNAKYGDVVEAVTSGKMPSEWAKNGVTEDHLGNKMFPMLGRGTSEPNMAVNVPGGDVKFTPTQLYDMVSQE